jgi:hypothetical protein
MTPFVQAQRSIAALTNSLAVDVLPRTLALASEAGLDVHAPRRDAARCR